MLQQGDHLLSLAAAAHIQPGQKVLLQTEEHVLAELPHHIPTTEPEPDHRMRAGLQGGVWAVLFLHQRHV
jgi:hypothetical protein